MMLSPKCRCSRGFSLAEALIAVAILAMIGTLTFGTFSRAVSSRERATAITDRSHQARQALLRMTREISMAFLSRHRDCTDPRTLTLFAAQSSFGGTRLDFTSFSHFKMRADAKESDQNELSYFVAQDRDHSGVKNLMRREQHRIDEKPDSGGAIQVLAEDVESLELEFYDPRNDRWQDDWDSKGRETKDRLPKYVKIKLGIKDANKRVVMYETKAHIFLKEVIFIPGFGNPPCID